MCVRVFNALLHLCAPTLKAWNICFKIYYFLSVFTVSVAVFELCCCSLEWSSAAKPGCRWLTKNLCSESVDSEKHHWKNAGTVICLDPASYFPKVIVLGFSALILCKATIPMQFNLPVGVSGVCTAWPPSHWCEQGLLQANQLPARTTQRYLKRLLLRHPRNQAGFLIFLLKAKHFLQEKLSQPWYLASGKSDTEIKLVSERGKGSFQKSWTEKKKRGEKRKKEEKNPNSLDNCSRWRQ